MNGILAFFSLAQNLISLLVEWMRRREMRRIFRNENFTEAASRALALLALADAARADTDHLLRAGRLREDDGYRRP